MSTAGRLVSLADGSRRGRVVVFAYPKTGLLDKSSPRGWDAIPGARGCTPESCGFRDRHEDLAQMGARIFGLSTQSTAYQHEMTERLALPFPVLSDERLTLARMMRLPTWRFGDEELFKRFTLVLRDARVEHVFYPVFPPDRHAGEVAAWLAGRRR
jgi:peroxiredoxin